jgi:hypothetical protein
VEGSADAGAALMVDVEVLEQSFKTDSRTAWKLSWKGTVTEALAAGQRMRLGKF